MKSVRVVVGVVGVEEGVVVESWAATAVGSAAQATRRPGVELALS